MGTETQPADFLTLLHGIPAGLLEVGAEELYQHLPGPTLIHVQGEQDPPLLVSVLLHGNEPTGWLAVQRLLGESRRLPRSLSLLIGNVAAARYGVRHLPEQPDFNRIWQGGHRPEHRMAEQVMVAMRRRGLWAAVDIHNNTGRNPHYACVSRLTDPVLGLAGLFGGTVLYYTRPAGLLAMALGELGPAVVLECGLPHEEEGTRHAYEFLQQCLGLDGIPAPHRSTLDLYESVGVVKVTGGVTLGFVEAWGELSVEDLKKAPLWLPQDLDRLNFCELPPGTVLGWAETLEVLDVRDPQGEDVGDVFFELNPQMGSPKNSKENSSWGAVCTRRPLLLAMLTLDEQVIHQDCLCYLMQRLEGTTRGS